MFQNPQDLDLATLLGSLNSISSPMFIMDKRGRFKWVNEAYRTIFGDRPSPAFISDVQNRDQRTVVDIWDSLYNGRPWSGEVTEPGLNGKHFLFANISPVGDKEQQSTYLAVLTDVSAYKRDTEAARESAIKDKLTGLANRGHFDSMFEIFIRQARRTKQSAALMLIDLDGFKAVNDTYGHDVGDAVLIESASRIQRNIRESDFCARLGGDEFCCVLSNLHDHEAAGLVAMKLVDALRKPIVVGDHIAKIGASIGISTFTGAGERSQAIFKEADNYLYEAKRAGKNTWRASYLDENRLSKPDGLTFSNVQVLRSSRSVR